MRSLQWTIQAHHGKPKLVQSPIPEATDGESLVRIRCAGLCRTDVDAALGKIQVPKGRILGHEAFGILEFDATGRLEAGQPVVIWPYLPCGECSNCDSKQQCSHLKQIGIDRQGCFAEHVSVPTGTLIPVPERLSGRKAAFLEPLTAALGITKTNLSPEHHVALIGKNRRMMLLDHMLKHFGFKNTTVFAHLPEATHFDVLIVEKVIDSWSRLKQCLKETGTVLFSNRSRESLKDLALNEKITVGRIPMGDPYLTVKWLQTDEFEIEDWLGPILTTERFISAFTKPEDVKIFYQP